MTAHTLSSTDQSIMKIARACDLYIVHACKGRIFYTQRNLPDLALHRFEGSFSIRMFLTATKSNLSERVKIEDNTNDGQLSEAD